MVSIVYVGPDGAETVLQAQPGITLMELAVSNGVNGIVGECGGACNCATCHVSFAEQDFDRVGPPNDFEDAMLDATASERTATSRLGCQVKVGAGMDRLRVLIAPEQI
jgi:ferredoxin, 2Fe-2S